MWVAGDPCPKCKAAPKTTREIEVGHIFAGTKYSSALKATYLMKTAKVGILLWFYELDPANHGSRREQCHDEDGIIWPILLHLIMYPLYWELQHDKQRLAEVLYQKPTEAGIETIIDDRNELELE